MKQSQFTERQIISALKEYEQGGKVVEISRQLGIPEKTFYRWKSKYGGIDLKELKRIKELEKENSELKKMYAEMALVNNALKALIEKKL
jgi:putative transposase